MAVPTTTLVAHLVRIEPAGVAQVLSFHQGAFGSAMQDQVRLYFARHFLEHTAGLDRLVIDLGGVEALDSAALGPLVQKLRDINSRGGALALCRVEAPALREIFALTRFDKVFPIFAERAAAVAAVQPHA